MRDQITVETTVKADIETVWKVWTEPEYIMRWMHASDDWHCPAATNDLKEGGRFLSTFAAKDGSVSFDLTGIYTKVVPGKEIAYTMDGEDARTVRVTFEPVDGGTRVVETFDPENENPIEMQRGGWQAILDNFKAVAEAR
jgi:uncharacterized protein YndB with AHSA1/START domain